MDHLEHTAFEKPLKKQPDRNWEELSPEEKKKVLFLRQKQTLDLFLREKMDMQDVE